MADLSHIDKIWIQLGKYGKYQIRQLIITLFASLPVSFSVVSIVFIGFKPEHVCSPVSNISENEDKLNLGNLTTYEECSIVYSNGSDVTEKTQCIHGNSFQSRKDFSFVTEWDLVCERDAFAKLSQILVSAGKFLGAVACPLADRFGRKPVHCFFNLGLFITSLLMAFIPNFTVFMILRFLSGAFQQGMILTIMIIWIEMFPKNSRNMAGILQVIIWNTSLFILLPCAYFLKDYGWRIIQLTLSLFSSIALIEYWLIDESLRWFLVNNRQDDAIKLITKISSINGVDKAQILSQFDNSEEQKTATVTSQMINLNEFENKPVVEHETCLQPEKETIIEHKPVEVLSCWKRNTAVLNLIRDPYIRRNSFIIWAMWVTDNLTYYGLLFMLPSLEGDIYSNYLINGLVEIAGIVAFIIVVKYCRRKNGLLLFHVVGGICLITTGAIGTFIGNAVWYTILLMIGKGAITAAFNYMFLYTPELYPTNLRNAGIGVASAFSRLSGMLAPFTVYLADLANWAPGVVFGVLCFVIAAILRLLPETKDKELVQTVEELQQWKNERNGSICKRCFKK